MNFRSQSCDNKLQLFKTKLRIVDTHIRQSENLSQTIFMQPELLEHINRQKPVYQLKNILTIQEPITVMFTNCSLAVFEVYNAPIEENHSFCVQICPSSTILNAELLYDKQKRKNYQIVKNQAIIIKEQKWVKLEIFLTAKTPNALSMAKVQLNTLRTEFKVKVNGGVASQRKAVEKQLQQYLKQNSNKKRVAEILEKRRSASLTRLKNLKSAELKRSSTQSNKNIGSTRNTKTAMIQKRGSPFDKKVYFAQTTRDWINFESSKQKYMKHLEKMSPQKSQIIKNFQRLYTTEKEGILKKFIVITQIIKFLTKMNKVGILISNEKMKAVALNLLCKKFIKNLWSANRLRLTFRVRDKLSTSLNVNFISCFLYDETVKKSEKRIVECFKSILFKEDVLKIGQRCLRYTQACFSIQKHYRKTAKDYRLRFDILSTIVKGRIFENEKQKQSCFQEYLAECRKQSVYLRFTFVIHHAKLDKILNKVREEEDNYWESNPLKPIK